MIDVTGERDWEAMRGSLKRAAAEPVPASHRRASRSKRGSELGLYEIPSAAEFSADKWLCDPIALIREFRRHEFAAVLREMTDTRPFSCPAFPGARKLGRPRSEGDYECLYLVYVMTGSTALQPFVNQWRSTALWEACGFDTVPSYQSIDLRFKELEEKSEAFEFVTQALIQMARMHEPSVGQIVMIDATAWKSPAALQHCCPDTSACRSAGRASSVVRSVSAEELRPLHWAEANELDPSDIKAVETGRNRRGIERFKRAGGAVVTYGLHESNGHFFRSLDSTSGWRKYENRVSWYGGYLEPAIDAVTGLAIAAVVFPADIQEYDAVPELFSGIVDALGELPYVVSVDRGYATRGLYEFASRRGVAVVSDMRRNRGKMNLIDWRDDRFDEGGIPRCQHCGGEGNQDAPGLGLYFDGRNEPRIRFKCLAPLHRACYEMQSIACAEEWMMLVPLSRKTELHQAVAWAHSNKEHYFLHARQRYAIAGNDNSGRLRRSGIAAQRLRVCAANLLDWYRLNLRHGWLEAKELPVTVNDRPTRRLSGRQDRHTGEILEPGVGSERLGRLLQEREATGATIPYGKAWQRTLARPIGSTAA
jgi:hypothetical protein